MPKYEDVFDRAVEEVVKNNPKAANDVETLIMGVYDKFVDEKVAEFPRLCYKTYQINKLKDKFDENYTNKGRFTDSYGWTKDRTMRKGWDIPMELKHFMENLVYKGFWSEDNAKVRDSFMKRVCQGGTRYDYEQLLAKVLLHYGTNPKNARKQTAKVIGGI